MQAYPRVCGVGERRDKTFPHTTGLSPRVRVGSLVFNVFEVMREPSMQIAYLFPELIVH